MSLAEAKPKITALQIVSRETLPQEKATLRPAQESSAFSASPPRLCVEKSGG
jgi:hypothetical protein